MNSPVAAGMVYIHVVASAVIGVAVISIFMHIDVFMYVHILMHIHVAVEIMVAYITASPVNGLRPRRRVGPVEVGLPGRRLLTVIYGLLTTGRRLLATGCRRGRRAKNFLTGRGCWGRSAASSVKAAATAYTSMIKPLGHNHPGTNRRRQDEEKANNITKDGIFHDGELIE
jgi:hypothetical protein